VRVSAGGDNQQIIEFGGELTGADLERLVVVSSDLEYLRSLPQDRLLTHTEVRLAASVLRRLIVENQLSHLLRSMNAPPGSQLTVEATYIDDALSQWSPGWVRSAWGGGATVKGAHHRGFIFAVVPRQEHEPYGSVEAFLKANPLPMSGTMRRLSLRDWEQSTSVAIHTDQLGLVRISRGSVVKYVANKKGGVHFDPKRKLNLPGKRRTREVEAHLLDHGLLRVGHLSGPEFEIASMVRGISSSEWSAELIRVANEAAPDQLQGDPGELRVWTGQIEADGTGWASVRFNDDTDSGEAQMGEPR
jgi:hypothetical protein